MTMPSGGMPARINDELLSAYLDGQISPAERDVVEAAIAADPAVRARAADLRATVALLHALPQPVPRRTFILTPEQAAAIRPVRVPWIIRLFPAVAAVGAVAAVLCLALVGGDLATGGFSSKQRVTTSRPANEAVSDATTTRVTSAAAAPTTAPAATTAAAVATAGIAASGASVATPAPPAPAAAAAALPAATVAAGSAVSARSAGAPPPGAAIIAPTATTGSFAASAVALPATPTIVAKVQPPPPSASTAPSGSATVTKETHRVPVALVRAGEIALALLAIAGIALAVLGWRDKKGHG